MEVGEAWLSEVFVVPVAHFLRQCTQMPERWVSPWKPCERTCSPYPPVNKSTRLQMLHSTGMINKMNESTEFIITACVVVGFYNVNYINSVLLLH